MFIGVQSAMPLGGAGLLVVAVVLAMRTYQNPTTAGAGKERRLSMAFRDASRLATIYLVARLWLWAPDELWILSSLSWAGALITVALFHLIPSLVTSVALRIARVD